MSPPDAALALLHRAAGGQEVAPEHGPVPGEPGALGALPAVLLAVGGVLRDQVAHKIAFLYRAGRRHELQTLIPDGGWCRRRCG